MVCFTDWWIGQCVRDWTHSNTLSYPPDCSHRCMYNIPYCICSCLSDDELTRFETCRRRHKGLNINLQNCAFHWFVLYKWINTHVCCFIYITKFPRLLVTTSFLSTNPLRRPKCQPLVPLIPQRRVIKYQITWHIDRLRLLSPGTEHYRQFSALLKRIEPVTLSIAWCICM
jgi:hypothetical protein